MRNLILIPIAILFTITLLWGYNPGGIPPYRPEYALGQALFSPVDTASLSRIEQIAHSNNASVHRVTRQLEIYMISWKPYLDSDSYSAAVKSGDWQTRKQLHQLGEHEVMETVDLLQNSGLVKWVHPNYYQYIAYIPNDPYYPDDGDHTTTSGPDQFDKVVIQCPQAWDIQRGSSSIILAIIDSGTDVDHPDLMGNIWVNPGEDADGDGVVNDWDDVNGVDNDGNGYVDDLYGYDFCGGLTGEETSPPDQEDWNPDIHYWGDDGWGEPDPSVGNGEGGMPFLGIPPDIGVSHGTHCSGIAAAVINNETMFAGVAGGGCKIMPVRVGSPEGTMTMSDVAAGIEYATIAGANVISMSLGGMSSDPEPAESVAIDFAWDNGVVLVAASGNNAGLPWPFGSDSCSYPASASNVIAVGSCEITGDRASFSQYGSMLDVVAPGGAYGGTGTITETIWSTWVVSVAEADTSATLSPGDHSYEHAEGTSMACPQVTGICGLILSEDPTLTNAEVRQILRDSAIDAMAPGFDLETGYGIASAYNAVIAAGIEENMLPKNQGFEIYPNPFNASCKIETENTVYIFDLNGRNIRRLDPDGSAAVWNGLDDSGNPLPNGIYFIRAGNTEVATTRPVILMK